MPKLYKGKKNRRTFLLEHIRQNGFSRGVEIGVRTGDTSFFLLRECPKLRMFLVDNWEPGQRNTNWKKRPEAYEDCWNRFQQSLKEQTRHVQNRAILLKMDSVDAAAEVEDESLDFIFIDADHKYQSVKEDIIAWFPKVRLGGLISGHDYGGPFKGVKKAVDEMLDNVQTTGYDEVWYVWKG